MAFHRGLLLTAAFCALTAAQPLRAETLDQALASAYANNPTLNAARAGTRATDEEVPQALAGYRPTVSAFASGGTTYNRGKSTSIFGGGYSSNATNALTTGITVTQPIFVGFRTKNGVRAAEAAVKASRESLRNTEQNTLFDGVQAYMDVIQDASILNLRMENVRFLEEQVRAANDRLQVGEGTRTDVAQAEAALADATSDVSLARANLQASQATYRQVIGHDPKNLKAPRDAQPLLPKSMEAAVTASRNEHPAILSAVHNADTAAFNVKIVEGELLPTVSLEGTLQRSWESEGGGVSDEAQIVARLSVPIYEGGATYSRVRQAKETLGQNRIQVDIARDQVQAVLVSSWGALQAARAQTIAARAQVDAARLALEGVIEEQRVGQRTTLDVLDSQNTLITAQIAQVQAEHDVIVAGYAVVSAIGRLSASRLGLKVAAYRPEHHYKQVRDKWIGLRTPDGR